MNPEAKIRINHEFIEAVKINDLHCALGLLEQGADLEAKDDKGRTTLTWAAHRGHVDVALALMDKGSDLEAKDNFGKTAFMFAALNGHIELTIQILEKGACLETADNDGTTALMLAVLNGHIELAIHLLGKGADPEAKEKYGHTALVLASRNGYADAELTLTSRKRYADVALALIAHGADSMEISSEDAFHGFTPLQACAAGGLLPKLMELLQEPAPSTLPADNPQALIELALEYKQSGAAGILQSHLAKKAIDDLLDSEAKNLHQPEPCKKINCWLRIH